MSLWAVADNKVPLRSLSKGGNRDTLFWEWGIWFVVCVILGLGFGVPGPQSGQRPKQNTF